MFGSRGTSYLLLVPRLCHLMNVEEVNGSSAWYRFHGDHFEGDNSLRRTGGIQARLRDFGHPITVRAHSCEIDGRAPGACRWGCLRRCRLRGWRDRWLGARRRAVLGCWCRCCSGVLFGVLFEVCDHVYVCEDWLVGSWQFV